MTEELKKAIAEGCELSKLILCLLPGDRPALEFLMMAGDSVGDQEAELASALGLSRIVVQENDAAAVQALRSRMDKFDDDRARAASLRLDLAAMPPPDLSPEQVSEGVRSAEVAVAVDAETELVKYLVSEGYLSETAAQSTSAQLAEIPDDGADLLISAMAILAKETLNGASDIVAALADLMSTPPLPLETFEIDMKALRKLPEKLVRVRGVFPVSEFDGEWTVAVLNPLDADLRRTIEQSLGGKCHFMLASPVTVEAVIERIFQPTEGEPGVVAPAAAKEG